MQSVCQLDFQVLTTFTTLYIRPGQVHLSIPKCIFMIPGWFASTFHILQDRLRKVVSEEFIEGMCSWVRNMIEFESVSSNVLITIDE